MFSLISEYAVNIFFSDQWEFNDATLFQKHTLWQMFSWQHGPHRQGLGALFERFVDPLSSWNSRAESFVVGVVIIVAALCAMFLKYRLYGNFVATDVAIPAIMFTPGQWETLVLTPNFAHGPFPLLLVMFYFLAWTVQTRKLKYPLVLFINFVTIYTGFGLLLGVVTPFLLIADYLSKEPQERLSRIHFAAAMLVAFLSLGSFFVGWKFNADLDCFSPQPRSPVWYCSYVALMLANFFAVHGLTTFSTIVGGVILVVLIVAALAALSVLTSRPKRVLAEGTSARLFTSAGMIGYSLAFCAATAYGRLCGGLPQSSRYAIYVEVGIFGLYLYLLSLPRDLVRKWSLILLVAAVMTAALVTDRSQMFYFSFVKREWKACYLRTEDLRGCNEMIGFAIFSHAPERTRLKEKLEYLKKNRLNLYLDSR